MLDFAAIPPEINSSRIYSGPGSAPMLAAASAWSALGSELASTATGYETVINTLQSQEWVGPSSAAMASSVAPFVAWLRATAAQAELSATKARSAAAAYEAAFASVAPPAQIAANRMQLTSLVSTNVLGQNTAAIAALEAQYSEMWARDAAAMYEYAGASAVASAVKPYASPPQISNSAAATKQAGAVTHAAAVSAGSAQNTLSQLISQVPTALQGLTSPIHSTLAASSSLTNPLQQFLTWYEPFGNYFYDTMGLPFFGSGITSFFTAISQALAPAAPVAAAAGPAAAIAGGLTSAAGPASGVAGGLSGGPVLAGLGQANAIGKMSVPATWAGSGPPASASSGPVYVSDVVEPPDAGHTGNVMGGMPVGATGRNSMGAGPRYGVRLTVMPRPPSAG